MKIYSKFLAIGLIILFIGVSFGTSVEPLSCDAYGPYEGNIMEDIEFDGTATGGIPPYEFFWDYGDGNTSSGDPHPTHNYANAGNYIVILTVTDSEDNTASDTTHVYINAPPNTPIIGGQTSGKVGQEYEYTFSSTDPDGDDVSYFIDWGDGTGEIDVGIYYPSGEEQTARHTWIEEDTYQVRIMAKDVFGADSEWGELEVSMPKSKADMPFGFIFVFGFDVDVKIVQLEPGEDYVDLEVLSKPFYILENGIQTRNPGEFIRLYNAKGLFSPSLPFCLGICDDWGIIG